jgi:hypothetical protein
MLEDFTWRNVALFVAALVVVSCLIAWGAIIAVDRVLYIHGGWNTATPKGYAIERPTL